jgi:hypothetical protein
MMIVRKMQWLLIVATAVSCAPAPAPENSCTTLWPELAALVPGHTTEREVTASWGEPDTSFALPHFLTPGWFPEPQKDQPGYVLPSGHVVQVFFADKKLKMAIITPPTALRMDSLFEDAFGAVDSTAMMITPDQDVFSLFYGWSDEGRILRVAVTQHLHVLMTMCGIVGSMTPGKEELPDQGT